LPQSFNDLKALKERGVKGTVHTNTNIESILGIISLNEEFEFIVTPQQMREEELDVLHIPCPDYFAPLVQDVEMGVKFIQTHVAKGHKVYVHCFSGKGENNTTHQNMLTGCRKKFRDCHSLLIFVEKDLFATSA
jgi:hypothetical protein